MQTRDTALDPDELDKATSNADPRSGTPDVNASHFGAGTPEDHRIANAEHSVTRAVETTETERTSVPEHDE
jgi:hypothetical protein